MAQESEKGFESLLDELSIMTKSMSPASGVLTNLGGGGGDVQYENLGDGYTREGESFTKLPGGCYQGTDGLYTKADGAFTKCKDEIFTKNAEGKFVPLGGTGELQTFKVMINGEEVDAFDGEELLKAMQADLNGTRTNMYKLMGGTLGMMKSLGEKLSSQESLIADQTKEIAEQGKLIKALTETVEAIGNKGTGRRTALDIHEPNKGGEGGEQQGLTPKEFMTKCQAMASDGKLAWDDVSRAESYLNRGIQPPQDIMLKVAG